MLRIKRILSMLIVIAMMVSMLYQTSFALTANSFSDIQNHWAMQRILKWADLGIIQGSEGKFKPNDSITRAEFCTIINNIFGFTALDDSGYDDITQDKWYYKHVMIAKKAGYISEFGKDIFAPNESISRQDIAKILSSLFQLTASKGTAIASMKDCESIAENARSAVDSLLEKGYMVGSSNKFFYPNNKITRAELIAVLDKMVSILYNKAGTYSATTINGNVIINQAGVELKDTSISGNLYLAPGIGEGEVTLNNVKVAGRTFINGGGSKSIHIENSTLGETIVSKQNNNIRIVLIGTSTIRSLELTSSIIIENNGSGSGIANIYIPKGLDTASIRIEIIEGSIGNIVLDSKVELVIKAGVKVSNMKLNATAKGSIISCEGKIQTVENQAEGISLNGRTLVSGSTVQVDGAKVTDIKATTGNQGGSTNSGNGGNNGSVPMWQLAWSDEFNGTTIDASKWNYDLGNGGSNPGWGNNEKELYTNDSKNVYQQEGLLNITAIKDTGNATYPYSSTRIKSQGKYSKRYGKIEAKIKLPEGKGLWPAFWMMPEDSAYGVWAASGEIDIMEAKGSINNQVGGTLHYGKAWPGNKYSGSTYTMTAGQTISNWHTYAIEWEPGEIRWYVDGKLYQTQNNWYSQGVNSADKYAFPAPFDQNFYIIMNLAVGGNYDGEPNENTLFPSTMQVDYVRIYELNGRAYKTPVEPTSTSEPLPEGYQVQADGNLIFNNQYENGFIEESDASLVAADTAVAKANGKWLFLHLTTGGNDFGGAGSISDETIGESKYAKADITSAGTQAYSVQLIKTATLGRGRYYKASFDGKSTGNRDISAKLSGDGDAGWATYSNGDTFSLTSEMKNYEFTFQMNQASDLKARFEFNLGLSTLPVWIGNVRLEEVAAPIVDVDATKTPLGDGNLIYNGTFDQGDMSRMRYWHLLNNNASAIGSVNTDTRELRVNIADGGTTLSAVQLIQKGMKLVSGQTYKVSFSSRATTARDISVELLSQDGSISYAGITAAGLNTTMEQRSFNFTMPSISDSNAQLVLNLGGTSGDVYIDNVVMTLESQYLDPSVVLFPLQNGFFQNPTLEPWGSYIHNDGATGSVSVENGQAKVSLTNTGNETWSIQLFQNAMSIAAGIDYEVSFDARSTTDRSIELVLDDSSYTRYLDETASLTSEMKHFSYTMKLNSPQTLNLKFLLGNIEGASGAYDMYIDNVVCEVKVGKQHVNMLENGTFTEGSEGTDNWTVWSDAGATCSVLDGVMDVKLLSTGNEFWSNQLIQGDFALASGKSYVLTFDASSSVDRTIKAILENSQNYTKYLEQEIVLDSNTHTYTLFINGVDDSNVHLVFALGKINEVLAEHDVFISNVSLMENPYGYQTPPPPTSHELLNGTFDTNLDNWTIYFNDGAGGTNSSISAMDGMASAVFSGYDGWFQWSTQLYQDHIRLEAGRTYSLSFDIWLAPVTSGAAIDISTKPILVEIGSGSQNINTKYLATQTVTASAITVDTTTVTKTFEFTMPETGDENGKLIFMLGSNNVEGVNFKPHTIYIDNVTLVKD